jgi:hypothetical protein
VGLVVVLFPLLQTQIHLRCHITQLNHKALDQVVVVEADRAALAAALLLWFLYPHL